MKPSLKNRITISIVCIISLGTLLSVLTICHPNILSSNSFLRSFVSHEIMAFLIVVLTITLASVANINLQITSMVRQLTSSEARRRAELVLATPLRKEVNSSAWLLFWAFVACAIALVIKGQWHENAYVESGVNSIAIVVMVMNLLVLYDIHQTIFALAPAITPDNPRDDCVD